MRSGVRVRWGPGLRLGEDLGCGIRLKLGLVVITIRLRLQKKISTVKVSVSN